MYLFISKAASLLTSSPVASHCPTMNFWNAKCIIQRLMICKDPRVTCMQKRGEMDNEWIWIKWAQADDKSQCDSGRVRNSKHWNVFNEKLKHFSWLWWFVMDGFHWWADHTRARAVIGKCKISQCPEKALNSRTKMQICIINRQL